ncbi:flagellin-like protein [Nitratireductor indicus C115]|uniref:Flagellin n=1 Tax=Nitratireductor indicus C115 TaxID=1231190 RepID=K2NUR4_9HYPH|nr:flagellin [Nitratireductor indicus]EKF41574.1 flagellin-like protein [Nitratireductor indicus C115]SFQ70149.1 flagellin [Nitratireductor indicus]
MASIMTNTSAMVALQSLKATNKAMDVTQGRISTGYRVAEASDNAAYWSIATTMRSDNKALSAVQDALGLGAGKIDTAYTAMNDALGAVDSIKAKLVTARGASAENQSKIQEEIKILLDQIKSSATGASYAGTNILATDDTGTMEVVASYNRSATGTVTVGTISIDLASIKLFAAGGLPGGIADDVMLIDIVTNGTDADIDGYLTDIETALSDISNAAANLGAAKTRLDLQKDFVSNLMDSIERGVGQLVDADMNEESTRLQALQVQQQLGIQALSIANQNAQSILALFK